jgi:Flp pilus assembly protein TadB
VREAVLYGAALLVSGGLLVAGINAESRRAWLRRIEPSAPAPASPRVRPSRFASAIGRHRRRVLAAAFSGGGAFIGFGLMGPVGLLGGLAAGPVISRASRRRAAAARQELLDRQLAEAVDTIAASVRAGLSVRRAVAEAASDVDPPFRDELTGVVEALNAGEPLDRALARLDRGLQLADARLLVTALGVHRRTGGDLPTLLAELGQVIRSRREDRRSVRALTAQARSSGVVLAVLPVGFVALLSGTGGDGLGALSQPPGGCAAQRCARLSGPGLRLDAQDRRSGGGSVTLLVAAAFVSALACALLAGACGVDPRMRRLLGLNRNRPGRGPRLPRADVLWARRPRDEGGASVRASVPDLLDVLAISVTAGLSPHLALARAPDVVPGRLGSMLVAVRHDVELGTPWRVALEEAASRYRVEELHRLSRTLHRAERLGSPVSERLRELAADVRFERRMRREERARQAPVQMLFPLVFLILPSFVLGAVVPALLVATRDLI